jgi:serine O-acetyltransferase
MRNSRKKEKGLKIDRNELPNQEFTFAKSDKMLKEADDYWCQRSLPKIADKLMKAYTSYNDLQHLEGRDLPSKERIIGILNDIMTILFPNLLGDASLTKTSIWYFLGSTMHSLHIRLEEEITKSLKYVCLREKICPVDICKERAQKVAEDLLERIPEIKKSVSGDIQAAYEGDPAATSLDEIVLSYPCVYAIATYRIAHELYTRKVPLIPRMMTEHAHSLTGIDIHPGARIGENFFIDHGTGVVIGETSEIGNNVRIYQGVTLGGKSFPRDEVPKLRSKKRHPTIEDDVIIYSEATILGGKTVIGKGSVIGGNVWITSSIPRNTTVTIAPSKLSWKSENKEMQKQELAGGRHPRTKPEVSKKAQKASQPTRKD